MSSSLCQVSQTCLEPQIAEPSILRLKLTPPSSSSAARTTNDTGGFNFMQCLAAEKETVYVPQRPASSKLTAASLATCTESLGSETGSESSEDISLLSLDNCPRPNISRVRCMIKKRGCAAFPPPLTSISGVRVRPHREDGRMIMTAVSVSPTSTNFLAERSDGRLRIRLISPDSASETEYIDEDDEEETEYIDDDEDDYRGGYFGERCENAGGKMGIESLLKTRISRCNGNNKSWERQFGFLIKPICLS